MPIKEMTRHAVGLRTRAMLLDLANRSSGIMGVAPPQRWPIGLIGMIAMLLVIEIGLGRRDHQLEPVLPTEWREANHAARLARKSTVVALGDSLIKNGVLPSVVEQHLAPGRTTYNLAASGSPIPVSYFLLRRLIESGSIPEAVVVDGQTLTTSPHRGPTPLPWHVLLSIRELANAAWSFRDPTFFAENAARKALPSLRHREMLRTIVTSAVTGGKFDDPIHLWLYLVGWNRNKGCHLLPDRETWPDPDHPLINLAMLKRFSGKWTCDRMQRIYVERFLALAAANHIKVYWLMMPAEPAMTEQREQDGWWNAYADFLRGLQTRNPHLTVIDGRGARYPRKAMADILHLSRTGAITFSDALGSILARADSSERWIELPRYEPERANRLAARSPALDVTQLARSLVAAKPMAPGVIRR
jgi:hypothetical protein